MDLLTRGAGFGYIGSTITALIYASFTFIFFALEAAVMAYALELAVDIPPAWGYLLCALVVIPLVTHGVTAISRLQVVDAAALAGDAVLPYVFVFRENRPARRPARATAATAAARRLRPARVRRAPTVGIALITQMGEQVDYLRFMPERRPAARPLAGRRAAGGPGWVIPGVLKMLGGALLAYLRCATWCRPSARSTPTRCTWRPGSTSSATTAGRWRHGAVRRRLAAEDQRHQRLRRLAGVSNFFSRLTHSHPGRVVLGWYSTR
jgi:purine-cytosine permease-like protein